MFSLVCMLSSIPLVLWQLLASCRPLFYGPQPKTGGQSSQKSLLFLCMIRMTSPLSALSASHRAATSPVAFLRLTCLTSSKPPPRLPPSWPPTPRYPQPPSSRALTGTMLWPLLLSAAPRRPSTPLRRLRAARPITTATLRKTPSLNTSWLTQEEEVEEEEVKALRGWRSLWRMKSIAMTPPCPSGWRRGRMSP